ncbi:MAG TPA: ATP-binding protein [Bacteroidia bacterium]|nr:ATP-binding protein [Bacteroidia bacterium]
MIRYNESNPFPVSWYHGAALFRDREQETKQLITNAHNGINTVFVSIRRMGKTGLLHHTLEKLKKNHKVTCIYEDIFDTESLSDFSNKIVTAILQSVPQKTSFWKNAMEFIKQLRPVFSYDELTGQPQVTFSYNHQKLYEHTLQSIFSFLENQNKPCIIALDEFQQIALYKETNMEAIIRTQIQNLKNVRFIFSGSSQHLLTQMFHHSKRPFFSNQSTLYLSEIGQEVYKEFIIRMFNQKQRRIESDAVDFVLDFTFRHTFYTQLLCNNLFADGDKDSTIDRARLKAFELLKQNEVVYYQYRTMLTTNQWDMLKAIAKEGILYQPNSRKMIQQYGLGTSSAVQRSIESLLDKELIYKIETGSEVGFKVYDCLFSRWIERY